MTVGNIIVSVQPSCKSDECSTKSDQRLDKISLGVLLVDKDAARQFNRRCRGQILNFKSRSRSRDVATFFSFGPDPFRKPVSPLSPLLFESSLVKPVFQPSKLSSSFDLSMFSFLSFVANNTYSTRYSAWNKITYRAIGARIDSSEATLHLAKL